MAVRYSINAATARCITWSFGKPGGEKRTLFRLNQTVHVTMANNSNEQSKAKTYSNSCAKPVSVVTDLKFHCGSSPQTVDKLGQDQRQWSTFSSWLLQTPHLGSVITQRRTRFAFVGSAFRQALHKKFFILLGTASFHICFHTGFVCSEDDPTSLELFFYSVLRKKYPDLTMYSPDCTKGHNRTSFASPRLKGILWTGLLPWG